MKTTVTALACAGSLFWASAVLAHGFGGAAAHPSGGQGEYHSGSGGYHPQEGSGAYHPQQSSGAYHPQESSEYHPQEEPQSGAYRPSNESNPAMSSEYHPAYSQGYPAAHSTQPADAGMGASFASSGAAAYHNTQPTANGTLPDQGNAVRQAYNNTGTFNQGWYGAHPDAWQTTGWAAGAAWSTAGAWGAVAQAAGISAAAQPVAYNYGYACAPPSANPSNPNSQPVSLPTNQNYQQSSTLAASAPPANSQSSDWTPLGVFALVHDPGSTPHYLMQLAVNKSGALAGNYVDLVTDSVKPVQGAVDKQSQRVAWTVGDNKSTVGEVGLYNLMQDQAPAILHMGPNKDQQWLLVRLKQNPANS